MTNMDKKQFKKIAYQDIISLENLKEGLARTKNNVASGLDSKVKASFTEKKLETLFKELKSQRFKPSPVKRVNISKPDGGTLLLGIASQKDKVVQAALLNRLEPVLENVFLDSSYGGRPNKNCHHALKHIKSKWQNITWFINIDLQKYFDTINHDILLGMLEEYCDQAAIELIRKFLKCGYINFYNNPNKLEASVVGTTQGSLISPIFSNLFLHSLDCFVRDELMMRWNRGDERKYVSGYANRKYITAEEARLIESLNLTGAKEAIERLKHNEWVKQGLPSREPKDDGFRRMGYVRYVDDFIIGFTGTKDEAEEIKNQIEIFLGDKLKLSTNVTKSYISHSSEKGTKYLGFYLRYFPLNKIVKDNNKPYYKDGSGIGFQLKATAINQLQLRIPVELILLRSVDRGYARIRKDGKSIRATSCRRLSSLEDKLIVQRFSSIIRGIMEYYSPANSRSDLWQIVALYRKSCALTLADKHKFKTAAKVYKKYGPNLKITDPIKKKETVLFYPTTLKTISNFKLGSMRVSMEDVLTDSIKGSYKSNIKTSNIYQWPGCDRSENLEEHHVNPVRNIKGKNLSQYESWLIKKKRKTVTLCREHHMEVEKLSRTK